MSDELRELLQALAAWLISITDDSGPVDPPIPFDADSPMDGA